MRRKFNFPVIGIIQTNLRNQLVAYFVVIGIIVLGLISVLTYFQLLSILEHRSEQVTIQTFQQAEYNIGEFQNEVDKLSLLLLLDAKTKQILDITEGNAYSFTSVLALEQQMRTILQSFKYIHSIFFYPEDGRVIGITAAKNVYYPKVSADYWFYPTRLYGNYDSSVNKLVWFGGNKAYDLVHETNYSQEPVHYILSAVREIKSYENGMESGTLVINVEDSEFNLKYSHFLSVSSSTSNSEIYILNDQGKLISRRGEIGIGEISPLLKDLDKTKMSGSFTFHQNGLSKQIVYYRLHNIPWIFIKEIPINEFQHDIWRLRMIIIIIAMIGFMMIMMLSSLLIRKLTMPIKRLTNAMGDLQRGKLGITVPIRERNELGLLGKGFNKMSESIENLLEQIKLTEAKKREIEIEALQSQINPHFLYNTLNTIKWMGAMSRNNNIVESITALGNLLRPIFSDIKPLWTLREEMQHVENYCKIMNYRYGEGVRLTVNLEEAASDCMVLRFMLQPLVENVFAHAMEQRNYIGNIAITGQISDLGLNVVIADDGVGLTEDRLQSVKGKLQNQLENDIDLIGIGLYNVNRQMQLYFGSEYGIDIESVLGEGTRIILRLPQKREEG